MDYNELLERYFEGLTSLDEERLLREHFAAGGGPDYARAMFAGFGEAAAVRAPKITTREPVRRRTIGRRHAIRIAAAAAVAALVFGLWQVGDFGHDREFYAWVDGRQVDDMEVALTCARDALRLMEANLDSTRHYLAPIGEIDRPLKYLEILERTANDAKL